MDPRVKYWTQGWAQGNFGDWLTDLLLQRALVAPVVDADRYRLLGSAIDEHLLQSDLAECADAAGATIALWCCGKRDEQPVSPALSDRVHYFGVRGPLTRDLLGLPQGTPMGDPGLLLPLIVPAPSRRADGPVLCVPHFHDPADPQALRESCGADEVVLPRVGSLEDVVALIQRIASAGFVLAGSLHAAITACAYGVPFGFWDTGYVDCPLKWRDFAASLGVDLPFCRTVDEAIECYARSAARMRRPSRLDILACCPYAVRPDVLAWAAIAEGRSFPAEAVNAHVAQVGRINAARRAARPSAGDVAGEVGRWRRSRELILRRAQALNAEVAGACFRFERDGEDLRFAAGTAGESYLVEGWSVPNEVGPWSLRQHSRITLPHHTGWWAGNGLQLGMIAFIPALPPFEGARLLKVWGNDIELGEHPLQNDSAEQAVYRAIVLDFPQLLRQRGGDLCLVFEHAPAISPATLGIGTDDRAIAIAPTYAKLVWA